MGWRASLPYIPPRETHLQLIFTRLTRNLFSSKHSPFAFELILSPSLMITYSHLIIFPQCNTADIIRIYDARSAGYDTEHNSLHLRQTQYYLTYLQPFPQPHASLLDLACGTGLLTLPAASKIGPHGHAVGIDISPGMLPLARQKSLEQ